MQIWTTLQETRLASALPFTLVLLVVACRCRLPPTCGAHVLEADVEVDRREFTLAVMLVPLVLVTHEPAEAQAFADRLAVAGVHPERVVPGQVRASHLPRPPQVSA